MRKNILITGLPHSGKSTLLNRIIAEQKNKTGFVTNEIRELGERIGFEVKTSNGKEAVIAKTDFDTRYKISRYYVEPKNLDVLIPEVAQFPQDNLLYLDEIGEMQLLSQEFRKLCLSYLDSKNTVIATISQVYENDFTKKIKERKDVMIIQLHDYSRERNEIFIPEFLKKIEKAKRYSSELERFSQEGKDIFLKSEHGTRRIKDERGKLICNCHFFGENSICSHVLATEEYLRISSA